MKRTISVSRTEAEGLINEWIFSERDRKILRRRLLDGLTFDELSEEFDLSTQRVKVIVYHSLDILKTHTCLP